MVEFNLEPIYVIGTHEDFAVAIAEMMNDGGGELEVKCHSHALAFDADGRAHWSALVTGHEEGPLWQMLMPRSG